MILDPRHKLDYYETSKWEPDHVAHARGALLQAIAKYATAAAPPQPDQAAMTARSGSEGMRDKIYSNVKRRRVAKESELERYLAAPLADGDEDALEWWRDHADTYPCLALEHRTRLSVAACVADW